MKVEREIAGFSLPFAAGVIAASYTGSIIEAGHASLSSAALAIAMTLAAVLAADIRSTEGTAAIIVTSAMALACGIFTGMHGHIAEVSRTESHIGLINALERCGKATGAVIDNIPFSDGKTNAVIKALLTGDRSSLPRETKEAFRASGASHILALSGLHLGIIYMVIRRISSFAGNSQAAVRFRSLLSVTLCGAYTGAVGAGESVMRAFLFISLREMARLTGRHASTSGLLLAALTIQLAISPLSAMSVGFQLSYAAMAGIAFIYPGLKGFWPERTRQKRTSHNPLRKMWDSAAMSISCQLTAGPIAYMYFGTFPKHFLLTNLIALPLSGIIIPCSLIVLALSSAGICPGFILTVTEKAVSYLIGSLVTIAGM